jgi:hypothetical protein
MRTKPPFTVVIDNTEVVITTELIDAYKQSTSKKRVTKRGIEKFFNRLFEVMTRGI